MTNLFYINTILSKISKCKSNSFLILSYRNGKVGDSSPTSSFFMSSSGSLSLKIMLIISMLIYNYLPRNRVGVVGVTVFPDVPMVGVIPRPPGIFFLAWSLRSGGKSCPHYIRPHYQGRRWLFPHQRRGA